MDLRRRGTHGIKSTLISKFTVLGDAGYLYGTTGATHRTLGNYPTLTEPNLKSWRGNTVVYPLAPLKNLLGTGEEVKIRGAGAYLLLPQLIADALENGTKVKVAGGPDGYREGVREWLNGELAKLGYVPEGKSTPAGLPGVLRSLSGAGTRPVFGDFTLAETVGLWLKRGHSSSALLLNPHISTEGFEFTVDEYFDLVERLDNLRRRYARLPPVSEALNDLNTGFFRHRSLEESKALISDHLQNFLAVGDALHREYALAINGNARTTLFARRARLYRRRSELRVATADLPTEPLKSKRQNRKILKKFLTAYAEYHNDWPASTTLPQRLETFTETANLIAEEQQLISASLRELPRQLRAENLSLSPVTASATDRAYLAELAERLTSLTREIDEAGLYQLPVAATDAATTPRQLKLLEQVLARLRRTRNHLAEYDGFYQRRYLWYAQPGKLRRVLAPLLDLPPEDWGNAFRAWYLERCLEAVEDPPTESLPPAYLSELTEELSRRATARTLSPVGWRGQLTYEDGQTEEILLEIGDQKISMARADDPDALHLSVAGLRRPELIFLQFFQPLHPPEWQTAPARADVHPLFTSPWPEEGVTEIHLPPPGPLLDRLIGLWPQLILFTTRITIHHAWTNDQITQALLSDGLSGNFLAAVLIRTAEAATEVPFDRESFIDLGREVRRRLGLGGSNRHPLAESLGELLRPELPGCFIEIHYAWRDTLLPLVVTSPTGKKFVLLPDGLLPGGADLAAEGRRQRELLAAGFHPVTLNPYAIWVDHRAEIKRLVNVVTG